MSNGNHARCTHRLLDGLGRIIGQCGNWLSFVGIHGEGRKTERWYHAACGFYTVLSDAGTIIRMTREEPRRGYFNHDHANTCRGRSACVAG